jgi:23S rRNA pseudouridine1911/1915/1917 synthase
MIPEIIYEDDDIFVVNKPAGLVVNDSKTSGDVTVQSIFSEQIENENPDDSDTPEDSEFSLRGGIVHRLDKDTSGILLIAKNERSFINLQRQFKKRSVEKEYIALVIGDLKDEVFEIDAPIKRNPRNRFKYAVVAGGKEAQTKFVKERTVTLGEGTVSVLKVYPKTGRTHQIRVHLAALDHPVAMDPLYSTRDQVAQWVKRFNRMMLHAYKITFSHPISNEILTLEAPIPNEFMIY